MFCGVFKMILKWFFKKDLEKKYISFAKVLEKFSVDQETEVPG